MDMCRITNKSKKEFVGKYDSNRFVVKPNKTTVVPRAAVNLWFGDPDTRDDPVDRNRSFRLLEFNRLKIKYGVYDNQDLWAANTPDVEVYDLDDNRLTTVVDDPTGETLDTHTQPPSRVELDMAAQLADMERQMEAMKRAIADSQAGEAGGLGRTPTEGQANRSEDEDEGEAEDEEDEPTPPSAVKVMEDKPSRVRGGTK